MFSVPSKRALISFFLLQLEEKRGSIPESSLVCIARMLFPLALLSALFVFSKN